MRDKDLYREKFFQMVPEEGWLREYMDYTIWGEGPAEFHFFIGAAVLGAALGRGAWLNKGYYRMYPTLQLLLVAPSGKCRKTTTAGIGMRLLQKLDDVLIVSDKATPEAILEALDRDTQKNTPDKIVVNPEKLDAVGVLYAPELAVLLGKQRYNEGMIALLTSLFDSPEKFTTRTKGGGPITLNNVAVTFVGASTPDWLVSAIPQDAFGGGFMSRILFVAKEDTPRCFAIPTPLEGQDHLVQGLRAIRERVKGVITLSPAALHWFSMWYATTRKQSPEDAKMSGYHERKPDHLLRLGMLIAASCGLTEVTEKHLMQASRLLSYLEKEMLYTFKWLGMRPIGQDQERIIRTLKANKGSMSHADLLRSMIFYMNAFQFKNSMQTLIESKIVRHDATDPHNTMYHYLGGE